MTAQTKLRIELITLAFALIAYYQTQTAPDENFEDALNDYDNDHYNLIIDTIENKLDNDEPLTDNEKRFYELILAN